MGFVAKRKIALLFALLLFTSAFTNGCGVNSSSNMPDFHAVEGLTIPPLDVGRQMSLYDWRDTRPGNQTPVPPGSGRSFPAFWNPPFSYDLQLAIEKGLCGEDGFGTKYLYMQALYRLVFESWLLESTSLREFDDRLLDSDLDFIPIERSRESFHQRYSTMDLAFIYMVNAIPIEKLNESDLMLLLAALETGQAVVTPELTAMVKRTFPDVLNGGYTPGGHSTSPRAPRDAIVLETRSYESHVVDGEIQYRDNYEIRSVRMRYMERLAEEMEQVLSEQMQREVFVVDYNGHRVPWR